VRMMTRAAAALFIATSSCSGGGAIPIQPGTGGGEKTGLDGTVRFGSIQPVCRENEPCDAPLQAGFTLQQSGRVVAHFASDSTGHFLVYTAPGIYLVVPDRPIGIGVQAPAVTVRAEGLTSVSLMFDTGIR
jgi:hypothetical protein